MSKKTKIFIVTFIITLVVAIVVYSIFNNKKTDTNTATTPWYQNFNPFGTSNNNTENNSSQNPNAENPTNNTETPTQTSRFHQITDFAIAGATFLEDTRPIANQDTSVVSTPEPIKTIIDATTKDGRKEIQAILNEKLSLEKPLVVDGNFGKLSKEAIKAFQKLNNLTETGLIDTDTAPFFTKTNTETDEAPKILYEQVPSVRYVERMNGHIYKLFLDTNTPEKISNSTIPSIYEAMFDSTGKTVVYRYLSNDNNINTFVATLGAPNGEFLPQNVSSLSVSQNKTNFFYLVENNNEVTGMTSSFGGTKKEVVFNHPFTEWLSQWTNNKNIYLTTKPSFSVDGSVFLLNTANKTISKLFGGVVGLTTLVSPNGYYVLYSTSTISGPKLGVFDINKHTTKDLGVYGLPEKCVWDKISVNVYCSIPSVVTGNQYPDSWYQGLISFDDYFVKINTITENRTTIADSTKETPVDGTYMFLSDKEDTLFFTNKKDSTFWSLNLK